MAQQTVRSRSGTISVVTTERGLPTAVKIDSRELNKAPQALAAEILVLCQLSAMRAQVARRRDLVNKNFSPSVIRGLHLATEDELAKAEEEAFGDDDEPPQTWMRSV